MAEKVAKLGVSREKDFMYYVKDGGVWKVQRKQPGVPKGRPEKVADGGFEMDTNYIYFVDRDGDVARAKRASASSSAGAGVANRCMIQTKPTSVATDMNMYCSSSHCERCGAQGGRYLVGAQSMKPVSAVTPSKMAPASFRLLYRNAVANRN